MPVFSVIVPVYNAEKYLKKCIESILNQTFTDFELILVNDGSQDRSRDICDEYAKKDSRISVIHKKNSGVSSARNAGIDIAKGEYISFIDSDDYVEKNYLHELYNTNVDMVICNMKYINKNFKSHYTLQSEKYGQFNVDKEIIKEIIKNRYISSACSKSYKREIIEENKIRFNTNISLGEDTMFVVDYIRYIEDIYISNAIVYNYIDYGVESLSKFSVKKLQILEKANEYIENALCEVYPVKNCMIFKKRIWSNYEWAIFEAIKSKNINLCEKINILNYVFNNKNYIELVENIDIFMENDAKIVRNILSIRSTYLTLLFFGICNVRDNLKNKKVNRSC